MIELKGGSHAMADRRAATSALHQHLFASPMDETWFLQRINSARNALKHFDAAVETVSYDWQAEAVDMLTRAIDNHWQVTTRLSARMEAFEQARRNAG